MNTTGINKTIAEKKGIKYSLGNGGHLYFKDKLTGRNEVLDYLSPELNHGLVKELIKKGWEPAYIDDVPWLTGTMYGWKNKKLDISIWNDDFNTATALAYIEAFK